MSESNWKRQRLQRVQDDITEALDAGVDPSELVEYYSPALVKSLYLDWRVKRGQITADEFVKAALEGNVDVVRRSLENGMDPNAVTTKPLPHAGFFSSHDSITALIAAADEESGNSPPHLEIMRLLLAHPKTDPNVNITNSETSSNSALSHALQRYEMNRRENKSTGVSPTLKMLLSDKRLNPNDIMTDMGYMQDPELLDLVLKHPNADVNHISFPHPPDYVPNPNVRSYGGTQGFTALDIAVQKNNTVVIDRLLEEPSINIRSAMKECRNPECIDKLHRAWKRHNFENPRWMLEMERGNPESPSLPPEMWRQIMLRTYQKEFCEDLNQQNRRDPTGKVDLLDLALAMGLAEDMVSRLSSRTRAEICEILSGILALGAVDSVEGLRYLLRKETLLSGTSDQINQLMAELKNQGVDLYNDDGELKSVSELLNEMKRQL